MIRETIEFTDYEKWAVARASDRFSVDFGQIYADRLRAGREAIVASIDPQRLDFVFCDDILSVTAAASTLSAFRGSPSPQPASPSPPPLPTTGGYAGERARVDISQSLNEAISASGLVGFVALCFHERPPLPEVAAVYGKLLGFSAPSAPRAGPSQGNLVFEDSSGRVVVSAIAGDARKGVQHDCVPDGAVVLAVGRFAGAEFELVDIRPPPLPAAAPAPAPAAPAPAAPAPTAPAPAAPHLLVISDPQFGGDFDCTSAFTTLTEWLGGRLPLPSLPPPALVAHVVVIGSLIAAPEQTVEGAQKLQDRSTVNPITMYTSLVSPTDAADRALALLAAAAPVTLVPGPCDPTDVSLPQRPIAPLVLPRSTKFTTLHRAPNPAWVGGAGVTIVATAATAADDLVARVDISAACEVVGAAPPAPTPAGAAAAALEVSLRLRHLAVTAPSSLDLAPCVRDVLALPRAPNVWISGGHDGTAGRVVRVSGEIPEGSVLDSALADGTVPTLLLAAPSILRTGCATMVNLHDLSFQTLQFGRGQVVEVAGGETEEEVQIQIEDDEEEDI